MKSMILSAVLICLAAHVSADVPAAWDWRDVDGVDYVSPVKSIGTCGVPYIFAPVAVVEARYRISRVRDGGALPTVDYSEQYIMTCGSGYFGGFDCDGGYSKDILTFIRDNGVPSEACYQYVAVDADCPSGCPDSGGQPVLHWPVDQIGEMTGFPAEVDIMQEIYDNGPVATTMDSYLDFSSYAGGVYEHLTGNQAGSTAITIIGWGDDGGTPYWICRNAWGVGWGDDGDFLIARNALHANCDFGEYVWSCTIDAAEVANTPMSMGSVKGLYR
jgi:C1A family cysteine protease